MHRHDPRCRDLFAKLSEYIDGELDASLCSEIAAHMDDCPPCMRLLDSLRRTIAVLGRMGAPPMPPEIRRELLQAAERLRRDARGA